MAFSIGTLPKLLVCGKAVKIMLIAGSFIPKWTPIKDKAYSARLHVTTPELAYKLILICSPWETYTDSGLSMQYGANTEIHYDNKMQRYITKVASYLLSKWI